VNWGFLTQMPENGMVDGGIYPALLGTAELVLGTVLVAVPLGVMAALYLSEYARPSWITRLIRLAILNLAGVPSIVYGLFGLGLFVIFLKLGTSLAAGSLTLGVLVLPIIITASEEALLGVPRSFREGSLALGATQWQTLARVVLPQATPGILTGTILGVGRAAGETAPILFTAAAFYLPALPRNLKEALTGPVMALPYHIYGVATQLPDAPERIQWGTASVLLLLVLGMSSLAVLLRARIRAGRAW
ncbi:MAG TPA: phosphate ABC transporter permease PstA, partial [Armatimonadota bacterium]